DGSVSVTSSDTTNGVTPAQRKEAVSQLTAAGYDESAIHFPQNKPKDPMYVPKGDRNFPGASSGSHGEGRGAQAGAVHDNPATRQWSSSGASHGGAACDGCEGIQRSNGIKNETGFQSQ